MADADEFVFRNATFDYLTDEQLTAIGEALEESNLRYATVMVMEQLMNVEFDEEHFPVRLKAWEDAGFKPMRLKTTASGRPQLQVALPRTLTHNHFADDPSY